METQPVNSFGEALELLTKLKDMKTRADKSGLEVIFNAGPNAGHFKIEPLERFECRGGVSSIENELHIHFTIVREGKFDDPNLPRTSLYAIFNNVQQTDAAVN
jgi:hypothetical protein